MERFEMWTGERWKDCARNKGFQRANEEWNILQTIKRGKADWIGYIWCKNCLLKHFILGKI
jgi:hypothetical protein